MLHRSDTDQAEVGKHLKSSSDAFRVNMKLTYWKTKIRSKWQITGQCSFGDDVTLLMGNQGDTFYIEWLNKTSYDEEVSHGKSCYIEYWRDFVHLLSSEVQAPGGHIEANEMMNIGSILTKALPLPVNDVPPTKMEVVGPTKECGENNKGLLTWKLHRKISCIYGDWPDDLIPPENLPSKRNGRLSPFLEF